jgi:RimJ/RimL family protein N-acetyltransferase
VTRGTVRVKMEKAGKRRRGRWEVKADAAAAIVVTRADTTAIPFIMSTERTTGFEDFVGRWDEEKHRAALADGRHAYFVARTDSNPIGFAILRDWAAPERVTLVKRVAVCSPGQGYGRKLLGAVIDLAFKETDVWRLWLGVFPDNVRAQKSYAAVGFEPEGVARGSAFFGGIHRDELVMALLRPEWEERRR